MEFPKCCGEFMEPVLTYRKNGYLYRSFHCNNRACGHSNIEVQIT
jgi:hypothetical protein